MEGVCTNIRSPLDPSLYICSTVSPDPAISTSVYGKLGDCVWVSFRSIGHLKNDSPTLALCTSLTKVQNYLTAPTLPLFLLHNEQHMRLETFKILHSHFWSLDRILFLRYDQPFVYSSGFLPPLKLHPIHRSLYCSSCTLWHSCHPSKFHFSTPLTLLGL